MAALWACRQTGHPAADRRPNCRRTVCGRIPHCSTSCCGWKPKGYVRPEKQGNKNIYTPLVRRVTYCGAVSAAHLQTLYGGDLRSMVAALSDTGRITNAEMERLARWLDTRVAESPEYDYD